jgi:hypothetical protein
VGYSSRSTSSAGDLHGGLSSQLDYYLPLPGLLDPSLEEMVVPLMDRLREAVVALGDEGAQLHIDSARLNRLGRVIGWIIKVRGWKAVGELAVSSPIS